ncbi:MAG TPA: Vps62-related protein, partial [Candidatus Polarisedimenticolia bacterium]|nr:Vps62-related protein [Candidatus Polarisedimenticolia bacterium]
MKPTHTIFLSLALGLAAVCPNQAEASPLTSVTVNGLTVPMNVISNYAPTVGLHYWEPYLPCSMDYILAHSTVVYGHPTDYVGQLTDGTNVIVHPTQQQLYQIATNDPAGTNYYLKLESGAYAGGPPAGAAPPYDSSVLTNVPMYVSVQVPPDKSFVDLNFYFIYAFNGSQTIRGLEPARHFNAILNDFAKHEGDVEGISVRITPDFSKIVFVRFEAHGDSSYYAPNDVLFDGSHPRVSCALNSHSSYNPKGFNANDWIVLKDIGGLSEGVDIINDGPIWRPYLNTNLILVGIDANNQPINGQLWAAFAGRLGRHQLNDFTSASGVGGGLDFDQQAWAETSGEATEAYLAYQLANNGLNKYDADNVGVGPGGL